MEGRVFNQRSAKKGFNVAVGRKGAGCTHLAIVQKAKIVCA